MSHAQGWWTAPEKLLIAIHPIRFIQAAPIVSRGFLLKKSALITKKTQRARRAIRRLEPGNPARPNATKNQSPSPIKAAHIKLSEMMNHVCVTALAHLLSTLPVPPIGD